jgi:hypothetical protein
MRLVEIASAQEQMALLRLIMDKTWEALSVQARQQVAQNRAAKARIVKARSSPRATIKPMQAIPRRPIPAKPLQPVPTQLQNAASKASSKSLSAFNTQTNAAATNDISNDDRHS